MEENVATVSEEVESAEIQEEETEETPETTEEESEASDQGNEDSGDDEETEEDSEESTEEDSEAGQGEDGPKKLTAQERIQQLANEKREIAQKLAELETKFNESREVQENQQIVDVQALNSHLGKLADEIEDLRLEGRHLEANLKEDERNGLIAEYKTWQQQHTEREQRIKESQNVQASRQKMLQSFDDACLFLAKENGIPEDTLNMMGKELSAMTQEDKVFAKQIIEKLEYNGPVHAAQFVHAAIKERMKMKEQKSLETKENKEEAKKSTVQKTGTSKGTKDPEKMSTEEWMKWREKQLS